MAARMTSRLSTTAGASTTHIADRARSGSSRAPLTPERISRTARCTSSGSRGSSRATSAWTSAGTCAWSRKRKSAKAATKGPTSLRTSYRLPEDSAGQGARQLDTVRPVGPRRAGRKQVICPVAGVRNQLPLDDRRAVESVSSGERAELTAVGCAVARRREQLAPVAQREVDHQVACGNCDATYLEHRRGDSRAIAGPC